jgi:dephospho-CoA kinase
MAGVAVKNKMVIGITGMPGAGKATVIQVAKELDHGIVVLGDVVREETKMRGLELTPENVGRVMIKLREENGPAVVAQRCIPKIMETECQTVIVDGIRSLYEVDVLKEHFKAFRLLAIHSSPETRFTRLVERRRSDDPLSWETFLERDRRELSVGVGSVIACADFMLINEGKKALLKREVEKSLKDLEKSGRNSSTSDD